MLAAFLLSFSLCIDSFAAGLSYGAGGIKIPIRCALSISLIGCAFLGVSFAAAEIIKAFIPAGFCAALSFILLFAVGTASVFQNALKRRLSRTRAGKKRVDFSCFGLRFILDVYIDETRADLDGSHDLSLKEAAFLAAALSFDSLAAGFGSGLFISCHACVLALTGALTFSSVLLGCALGGRFKKLLPFNISWISGVILISLAIIRLVAFL